LSTFLCHFRVVLPDFTLAMAPPYLEP